MNLTKCGGTVSPPSSQYIGVSGLFTPNWRRSWMGAEDIYRGVITSRPLPILPAPIVDKHIFIYIIQFRKIDNRHEICSLALSLDDSISFHLPV